MVGLTVERTSMITVMFSDFPHTLWTESYNDSNKVKHLKKCC